MIKWLGFLTAAILVGCTTIERAHQAQQESERALRETTAKVESLTLPEIVAFALTNSPTMVASKAEVEDSRLALKQIAAGAPIISSTPWNALTIGASAGYSGSEQGENFSDLKLSSGGDPSVGVSLDILVYDFGRNSAEAAAQAERVIAAEESHLMAGYGVFQSVATANYGYLEKLSLLEVAHTNVTACAIRLEQVELKHENGESMPLDVTRAKLDLVEAEEGLVSASNALALARVELASAVGVAEVEPGLGMLISLPQEDLHVVTNAPAYKVAEARVRAASHAVDRAIADLYPTISASASLSWTDPLWYLRWGVSAAQSLFTGFNKTTAVDRARVALELAVANRDEKLLSLMHEYERALTVRDNARKNLATAEKAVATAEENLALVDEQLKIGEATRVDFSDAITALYRSRGSLFNAEAEVLKSEVTIYALLGRIPQWATPL